MNSNWRRTFSGRTGVVWWLEFELCWSWNLGGSSLVAAMEVFWNSHLWALRRKPAKTNQKSKRKGKGERDLLFSSCSLRFIGAWSSSQNELVAASKGEKGEWGWTIVLLAGVGIELWSFSDLFHQQNWRKERV